MGVLPRLLKLWSWIDLNLFYIKVKFGYIGYCMGESEKNFFFGNYCSLRSQSCLKHSAKWVNEVEWVSKVKVILWPWLKVTQISKLNVWRRPVYTGERFRASWQSCFLYARLKNGRIMLYTLASVLLITPWHPTTPHGTLRHPNASKYMYIYHKTHVLDGQ